MNINKKEIIKLYNTNNFSQSQIARIFNVSPQYINQIVRKQTKNLTNNIKYQILKRDNFQCQFGFKCLPYYKQPNLIIHHIDSDHNNENYKNLITLCEKCHIHFHKLNNEEKLKKYNCKECKKLFDYKNGNVSSKKCNECINRKYWSKKYKISECIECGKNNTKHQGKGLCVSCFSKKRLKNDNNKRKLYEKTKKWQEKNREKKLKNDIAYNRKYYIEIKMYNILVNLAKKDNLL